MPQVRRLLLVSLLAFAACGVGLLAAPASAQAQDTWQYHMAQANSFYRNKLLPKALAELKVVVNDPEGSKQLKAWTLIQEIAVKLKDLESLVWSLEAGRELAKGPEAAQMQAQLYRVKRSYGRLVYQATGGSGKLSTRAVKLKNKAEIEDPEAKGYYEKTRLVMGQVGISESIYWLPAGDYEVDGEDISIVGGKDTVVEVAPTTFATLGVEVDVGAGFRGGATSVGKAAILGIVHVGVGPHIQFASGNSLIISVGPLIQAGAQQTPDRRQDIFTNDARPRMNLGGLLLVGLEFTVGKVDLSPRIGFQVSYMNGVYYSGKVVAQSDDLPDTVLSGEFVVPALGFGPRLGLNALVSPAIVKGKRRPRLFIGVNGGPTFAKPLWGGTAAGTEVVGELTEREREGDRDPWPDDGYTTGNFALVPYDGNSGSPLVDPNNQTIRIYADIQVALGIQLRL